MTENTQTRILTAAREMFFQHGFHRISVDDLVSTLGISKKTLYRSFPSKDRILEEIVQRHLEEIAGHIKKTVNNREMPIEAKFRGILQYIRIHLGRINTVFLQDLKKYRPDLYSRIDDFRRERIMQDFKKLFEEGAKRGLFRKDVDPRLFVMAYSHLVQKMISPETLSAVSFSAEQVYQHMLTIVLEGVLTPEARSKKGDARWVGDSADEELNP